MKKLFFVFAFLAFACGSDDDNNNEETSFVLVGTWEGTITEPGYDSEGQVELVLNSDSTGTLAMTWEADTETSSFSWSSTDTQINLNLDSEPDEPEILYYFVIDQDTMLVSEDEEGDDEFPTMYRQ
jgi:hypothetical protein